MGPMEGGAMGRALASMLHALYARPGSHAPHSTATAMRMLHGMLLTVDLE